MMGDIADRADQQFENFRDDAINDIRRKQAEQALNDSLTHCEDCDVEIPLARRTAIRGVTRCVRCQEQLERKTKGLR